MPVKNELTFTEWLAEVTPAVSKFGRGWVLDLCREFNLVPNRNAQGATVLSDPERPEHQWVSQRTNSAAHLESPMNYVVYGHHDLQPLPAETFQEVHFLPGLMLTTTTPDYWRFTVENMMQVLDLQPVTFTAPDEVVWLPAPNWLFSNHGWKLVSVLPELPVFRKEAIRCVAEYKQQLKVAGISF